MTGSGHEIKISNLENVFTTWILALFHYVFSGVLQPKCGFGRQNEFLPTQHRLEGEGETRSSNEPAGHPFPTQLRPARKTPVPLCFTGRGLHHGPGGTGYPPPPPTPSGRGVLYVRSHPRALNRLADPDPPPFAARRHAVTARPAALLSNNPGRVHPCGRAGRGQDG